MDMGVSDISGFYTLSFIFRWIRLLPSAPSRPSRMAALERKKGTWKQCDKAVFKIRGYQSKSRKGGPRTKSLHSEVTDLDNKLSHRIQSVLLLKQADCHNDQEVQA